MTTEILALVASYVLLALLALVMILYSRLHWLLKAGVIVLVSAFYPISYFSLMALLGWPTEQHLPDRFRLVAAQVYEPDKQRGTRGAIYLWTANLSKNAGRVTPRAYELPYSMDLHTKVAEARKQLQKGVPQMGEVEKEDTTGVTPFNLTDISRTAPVSTDITFYALSDTVLPEK